MGRLVSTRTLGAVVANAGDDERALTRIAKYIPAEILAFFAMWTQGAASLPWADAVRWVELGGALVGLVATYLYFDRFFPESSIRSRIAHKRISTLAFGVYAYNLSAGAIPSYFVPGVALLLTAAITLVSALIIPSEKPAGN
jgi:hypothetical protein